MKCEIFRNGVKFAGPMQYSFETVASYIKKIGGDLNHLPHRLTSMVVIGNIEN